MNASIDLRLGEFSREFFKKFASMQNNPCSTSLPTPVPQAVPVPFVGFGQGFYNQAPPSFVSSYGPGFQSSTPLHYLQPTEKSVAVMQPLPVSTEETDHSRKVAEYFTLLAHHVAY